MGKSTRPFWFGLVEMCVATLCIIAVLLVMASNPWDGDEFSKGGASGIVAYTVTALGRKFFGGAKDA